MLHIYYNFKFQHNINKEEKNIFYFKQMRIKNNPYETFLLFDHL